MSWRKIDKNKYRVEVSAGYLNNKRIRTSKVVNTTLKGRDLNSLLMQTELELLVELEASEEFSRKMATSSFEEYSKFWLDYKEFTDKTREDYTNMLDLRIVPALGKKQLDKITTVDLIKFMNQLKKTKSAKTEKNPKLLSEKTIKNHFILIRSMFNDAIEVNILEKNPINGVPIPKVTNAKLKDNFFTQEELEEFIPLLLKEKDTKYKLIVLLALDTGARLGELVALTWSKIDTDNCKILIDASVTNTTKGGLKVKGTKTGNVRELYFGKYLLEYIEAHKKAEEVKKAFVNENTEGGWYYGNTKQKNDFVFTQRNGKVMFKDTPSKWLKSFLERHKLRVITFHGLRHTNITQMLLNGTDYTTVANRVGHSKVSTTMDFYAHTVEAADKKAAEIMGNIIKIND